jgi:hypothetical protein
MYNKSTFAIENNSFNNEKHCLLCMVENFNDENHVSKHGSAKDSADDNFEKLKKSFLKEVEGIKDIDELKEVYAREIARRDKLLAELQEKNELLFKSAIKNKLEELKNK